MRRKCLMALHLMTPGIFWTKSRLLPVLTCIFALSATDFGIFARRALVRSCTPMISCLSNARSEDLHFGASFVALRALVREIIPNTIPSHPHTYPHEQSRISIDCLIPASRLQRSASVWIAFTTYIRTGFLYRKPVTIKYAYYGYFGI